MTQQDDIKRTQKEQERLITDSAKEVRSLAEKEAKTLKSMASKKATELHERQEAERDAGKATEINAATELKADAVSAADILLRTAESTANSLKVSNEEIALSLFKVLLDNAMFHAIFDNINDGIIVTNSEGKMLFFNKSALKITGLTSFGDVNPSNFSRYYKFYKPDKVSEWPAGQDPLSRALKGKTTVGELIYVKQSSSKGTFISCMAVPLSYSPPVRVDAGDTIVGGLIMFRKLQQLSDGF